MSKESIIKLFFGNNNQVRFKRLVILVLIIIFGYVLSSNIRYTKKNGFEWVPSISIEVKK